jgi:hypothetical protein
MDDAVYILGLDPELLSLPFAVPRYAVALLDPLCDTNGIRGLLGLCLGDQIFNPALLIHSSLPAMALIDSRPRGGYRCFPRNDSKDAMMSSSSDVMVD